MPRHPPCALSSLTLLSGTLRSVRASLETLNETHQIYLSCKLIVCFTARAIFCCEGATAATSVTATHRSAVLRVRTARRPKSTAAHPQRTGLPFGFCCRVRSETPAAPIGTRFGGAGGIRTPDFRLAKAALSQLSYGPRHSYRSASTGLVGHPGFEPGTSVLSGLRSNQLS